MTRATILFATLNGAHTLPRMLATLGALTSPSGGWKVVAVDNGSTDDSLSILEQHAGRIPMTVLREPRRGKNIALNAGLALAEGDIIAFTDDDIILPRDWLVSIESVAARRAEYDIFGGVIYPIWEEPPPAWVFQCVPKFFLGWSDFPEGPIQAVSIWGGNMAVCADVFCEHKFAEGVEMGSETEFTVRAVGAGHRCWHFHAAPVGHIIRPYQLKREWHAHRAYNHGRGDAMIFHLNNKEALGQSLYRTTRLIKGAGRVTMAACKFARSRLLGDDYDQFKAYLHLQYRSAALAPRHVILRAQKCHISKFPAISLPRRFLRDFWRKKFPAGKSRRGFVYH
jgi:glycosyltransferase involved in cell wall biosynthesis